MLEFFAAAFGVSTVVGTLLFVFLVIFAPLILLCACFYCCCCRKTSSTTYIQVPGTEQNIQKTQVTVNNRQDGLAIVSETIKA
jgi:hypothetical protein